MKLYRPTYISTLSTFTPHGSVASSSDDCITWLILSRSDKISAKFFVPNTFRRVVAARSRVEWLKTIHHRLNGQKVSDTAICETPPRGLPTDKTRLSSFLLLSLRVNGVYCKTFSNDRKDVDNVISTLLDS